MLSTITPVARPVRPLNNAQTTAPSDGQRHATRPVGVLGDRHLQGEGGDRHQGDQAEHLGVVEVELVADVRQQDPERGAVELVDGVEAEQHDQREGGLATADVTQPSAGMTPRCKELARHGTVSIGTAPETSAAGTSVRRFVGGAPL